MLYESGDDPQLLEDLQSALRHWHKATLGDLPLAHRLQDVERRLASEPQLTRASALQQSLRAALAWLGKKDQGERVQLLERRYFQELGIYRLQEIYHLGERSIYYRLKDATVAMAQCLWMIEQEGDGVVPAIPPSAESIPGGWRARHLPPPTYARLFGIDGLLVELLGRLEDRDGHWMVSLDGMGGLGKTALAREAAGRLAHTDRFAGIAWLRARPDNNAPASTEETGQAVLTCSELLEGIARQLAGVDIASLPFRAKRERVETLLRSRPYLVVVDNLEMVTGCENLPGLFWQLANPTKFLFTSRQRIKQEPGLSVLPVNQLSEQDALALIRYEGHLRGLQAVAEGRNEALCDILEVTGGNPLAIKLVVGQLATLPLGRVLDGLEHVRNGHSLLYEYLYSTAWSLLSGPARHLLRQMAILPDGSGSWTDLSTISFLDDEELAAAIAQLVTYSLVQVSGLEEKTYCLHPLTCHFVLGQVAG